MRNTSSGRSTAPKKFADVRREFKGFTFDNEPPVGLRPEPLALLKNHREYDMQTVWDEQAWDCSTLQT